MTPIVAMFAQEEVSVRGVRTETGSSTIAASDAREMPGAFGDTMRAVEALPGVTSVVSGLPYFFVRGAPPNNTAYFLDGVRVPLLFHVGLAQSVIHPGLVERVDFLPGAAPAQYGGYAGAIVAGTLKPPNPELHGEANLRLVDAGGLVEAPFADGRGTALAAARYGYPGPVAGLFTKVRLDYWDSAPCPRAGLSSRSSTPSTSVRGLRLLRRSPRRHPLWRRRPHRRRSADHVVIARYSARGRRTMLSRSSPSGRGRWVASLSVTHSRACETRSPHATTAVSFSSP